MKDAAARVAFDAYRSTSLGTRFHVAVRWRTCPFPAIAQAVAGSVHVLDVGCGHGLFALYLATRDPSVRVVGVDVDVDKIEIARAAAIRAGVDDRVSFIVVPPGWTPTSGAQTPPEGGWDAIVVIDVLYLLGPAAVSRILTDAVGVLGAQGRLVVKELDTAPRWKWRISLLQEVVATKVLRITEGRELAHVGIADLEPIVRSLGYEPTTVRLDHRRLHPDYLTVAARPTG